MLRITLKHSAIGSPKSHKATIEALGLRRLHQAVLLPDNPQTRGMVRKVSHLVAVEEARAEERAIAEETSQKATGAAGGDAERQAAGEEAAR